MGIQIYNLHSPIHHIRKIAHCVEQDSKNCSAMSSGHPYVLTQEHTNFSTGTYVVLSCLVLQYILHINNTGRRSYIMWTDYNTIPSIPRRDIRFVVLAS